MKTASTTPNARAALDPRRGDPLSYLASMARREKARALGRMKRLFPLLALLLVGCGYVVEHDPIQFAGAPKWRRGEKFFVFSDAEAPTNNLKVVCTAYALSEVGTYPDDQGRIKIAKDFAERYGGNGAILGHGEYKSTNAFNVIKVIYVSKTAQ